MKSKILKNIRNYGAMVLLMIFYVLFAAVLQAIFKMDAVAATILSDVVVALFSFSCYFDLHRKKVPAFQLSGKLSLKYLGIMLLGFTVATICVLIIFIWAQIYIPDPLQTQRSESFAEMSIFIRILLSCIIAPITEEVMFRLFLYNLLRTESNWIVSMISVSFMFALLHGTMAHIILATLFGIMMTLIYERTKVWYAPVLCHILYNSITLFISTEFLINAALCPPVVIISCVAVLSVIVWQVIAVSDSKKALKEVS